MHPQDAAATVRRPNPSWPDDVLYSLSHVALPFHATDPLHSMRPAPEGPGVRLGALELGGERGVLQISAAEMLRLRWLPVPMGCQRSSAR